MGSALVVLWASLAAVSLCSPTRTTPAHTLLPRDAPDPEDLSWIKNWASVGDSYSAGIGSGNRYGGSGDYLCSRYDASFPALINVDDRLGSSGRTFNYLPCSGAKTADVIKQVNRLADSSQDLITITSGGNDAFLSDILNECVFQWFSDATIITSQCGAQLSKAQAVIDSADFHQKLDTLISTAKNKLTPNGQIIYTGYGRFFGEDSNQCDSVTWAFWYNFGKREYLTQEKRKSMNQLVLNMNQALNDAVTRAGDRVTFVDYDKYFVESEGRFCEDGYIETSPNRYGLLFYEWNTDDNADETDGLTTGFTTSASLASETFQPSLVMNGTFEAAINDWVRESLASYPSWNKDLATAQGAAPSIDSVMATDEQKAIGYSRSSVPDSYGRVFHPRPNGHALIADLILFHVSGNYAKRLNQRWYQEELTTDTCPVIPPQPSLSAQYCFPRDAFGTHGDISPSTQASWAFWTCAFIPALATIKDDPSTFINVNATTWGVPYKYTVTWEPNCVSSVTEVNLHRPIPDNVAISCTSLMRNNYIDCNNGGIGGSITVGCVKYEFKASLSD